MLKIEKGEINQKESRKRKRNEKKLSLLSLILTLPHLQDFSSRETVFYFYQFLSNFLRYSVSNFPSSHPYSSFTVYLPSNSILLYPFSFAFLSPTCYLTSALILSSKSSTNFFAFFRSSFFFHVLLSIINPFHYTKYFSTPLIFLLFSIFSTSHSSTSLTSTGFRSFLFYPFTCPLY